MAAKPAAARSLRYEIDLNLLPRARRRAGPQTKLLTLLALLFAIVSMVRLSDLYLDAESQVAENEARLRATRVELARMRREVGDLNHLAADLEATKKQEAAIKDSLEFIGRSKKDWSNVLQTIQGKTGREVALESLIGVQWTVRLRGKTRDLSGALAFVTALEDSQRFSRVVLLNYSSKPAVNSKPAAGSASTSGSPSEPMVDFEILADLKKP